MGLYLGFTCALFAERYIDTFKEMCILYNIYVYKLYLRVSFNCVFFPTASQCPRPQIDIYAKDPVYNGSPIEQALYVCKDGFKSPATADTYTNLCDEGKWQDNGPCIGKDFFFLIFIKSSSGISLVFLTKYIALHDNIYTNIQYGNNIIQYYIH